MTIYLLELAEVFPKRRKLSENSVAWLESDIAAWADSRPIAHLQAAFSPPAASAPESRGTCSKGGEVSETTRGNRDVDLRPQTCGNVMFGSVRGSLVRGSTNRRSVHKL